MPYHKRANVACESSVICIIFSSCGNKKIAIPEGKYILEWEDLPYHSQSDKMIMSQLGESYKTSTFKVFKRDQLGKYMSLERFLPSIKDTIIMKELLWKQDSYLIYYWFIKQDSVWTSVDGIIYDPKHVEF